MDSIVFLDLELTSIPYTNNSHPLDFMQPLFPLGFTSFWVAQPFAEVRSTNSQFRKERDKKKKKKKPAWTLGKLRSSRVNNHIPTYIYMHIHTHTYGLRSTDRTILLLKAVWYLAWRCASHWNRITHVELHLICEHLLSNCRNCASTQLGLKSVQQLPQPPGTKKASLILKSSLVHQRRDIDTYKLNQLHISRRQGLSGGAHQASTYTYWAVSTNAETRTHGRESTLVRYRSVVLDPCPKTSLPPYFLANLTPNCVHLFTAITPPRLPQAHLSRDSRCITYQWTLTHLPLVCHLRPYQNLVSHYPWKIIATAGVVRDKPYGFSNLRAAVELQIGWGAHYVRQVCSAGFVASQFKVTKLTW